ncbi:Hypothetical predicted protein [Mytilus galloprovincialis]|uniref:ShKT domain-containing protein n=1 Tax=Mytilus galloprovincialis TaxID=29158 RepID=A0A8B6FI93_MYTGA|nr:Hypothetical predicted protein [Mytilus galloprovincialis]
MATLFAVGCVDKRGDCASYAIQTCTNPKYTEWVKDNCARTCLCSGGSYYTGRYVGTSGSGTGTIAGSNVQVTITAITTPVPKKTTTSSKTFLQQWEYLLQQLEKLLQQWEQLLQRLEQLLQQWE